MEGILRSNAVPEWESLDEEVAASPAGCQGSPQMTQEGGLLKAVDWVGGLPRSLPM